MDSRQSLKILSGLSHYALNEGLFNRLDSFCSWIYNFQANVTLHVIVTQYTSSFIAISLPTEQPQGSVTFQTMSWTPCGPLVT